MQEQAATIAVPDAQARVAVASLVRETRAAAEIGAIADIPAAEHDRDIARPRIVWYSFHRSFPAGCRKDPGPAAIVVSQQVQPHYTSSKRNIVVPVETAVIVG